MYCMLFKAAVVTLCTFVEYFMNSPETKWLSHSSCNHDRLYLRGFVACKTIFVASLWTIVERYECTTAVHFSYWKIYFMNERKLSLSAAQGSARGQLPRGRSRGVRCVRTNPPSRVQRIFMFTLYHLS